MNPEHYDKLTKEGVDAWNKWRANNPDIVPQLQQANLTIVGEGCIEGTNLAGANLKNANLVTANLAGTNLRNANLRRDRVGPS